MTISYTSYPRHILVRTNEALIRDPGLAPPLAASYTIISCFFCFFCALLLSSFWTSRGHRCSLFFPQVLAFNFIAHRVQQSHCSSIFHRVLLAHALALSANQFVNKEKSLRMYTSMHSAGLELTKLAYTTRGSRTTWHATGGRPAETS